MNRNELIDHVAGATQISKKDAGRIVDAVFEGITGSLKKGDEVRLPAFGTFAVTKREAKEGRNPRTGETINIAAALQPKFKPGKALKDALNVA